MARFDWYQGTFHQVDGLTVLHRLEAESDLAEVRPTKAKNGYRVGYEFRRGTRCMAEVWWDGNPGVHVIGKGQDAPWAAKVMREIGAHNVTRLDACEDWIEAGLFNRIAEPLVEYAGHHGIRINQQGDWVRGQGRTLYLGARESVAQLVLYEKGYQVGGDPNWVRLEARVYPAKDARAKVSTWTPGEAFGATRWMAQALETIGWDHLQAQSIGTIRRPSDQERQRRALLRQYGNIIQEWVLDAGGWHAFTRELYLALEEGEDASSSDVTEGKGVIHH